MDTVVPPRDDNELHLLTEWGTLADHSRTRRAGVLSVVFHGVLLLVLLLVPAGPVEPPEKTANAQRVTPLVEPPPELTQTAPNTRKPTKEFNVAEVTPRPRIQIPQGAPSTTRKQAPRPAEVSQPPAPRVTDLPEPPKLDAGVPKPVAPPIAQVTPQIEPVEKPKLALENPAPPPTPLPPGQGKIPIPSSSVSEAIRQSVHGGGGGLTVGDLDLSGPGGVGPAINLPPAPGVQGSQLELLSDPMGVDFRPYLTQVLAAVRRNWLAVIPESARLGRQGRVTIQFSIGRDGYVPKLVITGQSGTDAFDRAAVSGISASQTFPPFPPGFKGDRVVLQFNFAYNMPRR
ncbi:MAG: TonB family protein [Acidobacteriia bacterium]|nr:TonB family protein [Terriglobia bacterium]